MPRGFDIETIETYSKWSNLLQLAFGLLSILAFVSVNVIQTRFFPIQAITDPQIACFQSPFFAFPPFILLLLLLLPPDIFAPSLKQSESRDSERPVERERESRRMGQRRERQNEGGRNPHQSAL